MKAKWISLTVISVIVLCLFLLGGITASPDASSGNGNPAFFILAGLVPFFFVMFVLWLSLFRMYAVRVSFYVIGLLAVFIHVTAGFFYQRSELNEYREVIRKALVHKYGSADAAYIQDITSGLTIHVNNQYFNVNTFFMFISLSVFAAILFRLWDHWDQWEESRKTRLLVQKKK